MLEYVGKVDFAGYGISAKEEAIIKLIAEGLSKDIANRFYYKSR